MLRWHAKAICGIIMFILMPVCFLLPVKMVSVFRSWGSRGQNFLDLLSCFAGGVFLASYLVFMAPAVRVLVEQNLMVPYNIDYPLPDMLIGLGFFFMLAVNYVVRTANERSLSSRSRRDAGRRRHSSVTSRVRYDSCRSDVIEVVVASSRLPVGDSVGGNGDVLENCIKSGTNGNDVVGTLQANGLSTAPAPAVTTSHPAPRQRESSLFGERHSAKCSSIVDVSGGGMSTTRSIIMMLALSIDSVLEGMTIGLKQTVVEVWAIFVGIVVHESIIAFCLGLQLVRVNRRLLPVLLASLVYTAMNPVGLIVATAVYETFESDPRVHLANGILQALTSGCFIYVIFYEILDGLITERTPLPRIVAVFVGYAFLASFAAIPGSGPYHHGTSSPTEADWITRNETNETAS